jgi:hypothetical protein
VSWLSRTTSSCASTAQLFSTPHIHATKAQQHMQRPNIQMSQSNIFFILSLNALYPPFNWHQLLERRRHRNAFPSMSYGLDDWRSSFGSRDCTWQMAHFSHYMEMSTITVSMLYIRVQKTVLIGRSAVGTRHPSLIFIHQSSQLYDGENAQSRGGKRGPILDPIVP